MQATQTMSRGRRGREKGPGFRPLFRAVGYLKHYRRMTVMAYSFLVLSVIAQLMVPKMVSRMLDAVTTGMIAQQLQSVPEAFLGQALATVGWTEQQFITYSDSPERVLYVSIGLIIVFAIMQAFFGFAQTFTSESVSQNAAFDMRNELFSKVQRLSFSYHDRNQTGQLMVRATDDVEKVRIFIGQGLLMAVQSLLLLTGTLIILLLTNVRLTLIILPVLPIALALFMVFGAVSQPLFAEVQRRLSRLNTILQENLAGIKVVKAYAREPQERTKFDASATSLMEQSIHVSRIFAFLFPIIFLIANLGQVAIIYYGGRQLIGGTLSFGEWQEFSLYLVYVFFPIGQLGFIISQMSQASASANRVFDILDTKNDVVDKPDAIELPPIEGNVRFENVTFRYYTGGEPVLSDVSIDAKAGETIALLGATGSGKTTVINLIPRFYDPSEGSVLIDGYAVNDVKLDSLRSKIGIVLQETTLFGGTIRDNIAFGRPDASEEDVIAAAKAAAAHSFIIGFPKGYDTPVGERGTTLSGGQKQRIAIARALLLDPHILILDDSTSSVDLATEYEIQKALDKLMHGRTSFVIAQRISTVVNADQIIVLDKGRVVARGKHDDLMENSPEYADIYSSQLVEDATLDSDAALPIAEGRS